MRIRSIRLVVTLLILSVVAVGALTACGSSSTPSNAPTPAKSADGCPAGTSIPQGGGDQDGDNSGGSSDGDGCV